MTAAILVLFGYLLGSIPCACIAGRLVKGVDVRTIGDGNAGAANVYRNISHRAGIAVLVADTAKGAVSVLVAHAIVSQPLIFLCGAAAVAGHNWPLFCSFKGGRGQATTIGVLTTLMPVEMGILLAICAVPFLTTRNTMLAGAILFSPLWLLALLMGAPGPLVAYSIGLPCLVGLTHFLTTRHLPDEARREAVYMR
jgi:glycerol-3-phosphate acyltransferase PlsY